MINHDHTQMGRDKISNRMKKALVLMKLELDCKVI